MNPRVGVFVAVFVDVCVAALPLLLVPEAAHARPGQHGARARRPEAAPISERSAKSDKPAPDRGAKAGVESADKSDSADEAATPTTTGTSGKTIKTKTYTFGAMDVEGKLKTPQLLYFLNRVKLELDMSAPDKRSFMKELVKSADDKSL